MPINANKLASIPEPGRKRALDRFRILQPYLEEGRPLNALAASIPYCTAHRWVTLYRKYGLSGLGRRARNDRGGRRAVSAQSWKRPGRTWLLGRRNVFSEGLAETE